MNKYNQIVVILSDYIINNLNSQTAVILYTLIMKILIYFTYDIRDINAKRKNDYHYCKTIHYYHHHHKPFIIKSSLQTIHYHRSKQIIIAVTNSYYVSQLNA